MSTKRTKAGEVSLRTTYRQGEGVTLALQQTTSPSTSGKTDVEFSFNLASAPVPERRYAADFCGVMPGKGVVYLLFGQRRLDSETNLRSLLSIRLTFKDVRKFVESLSSMGDTPSSGLSLAKIVENLGAEPEAPATQIVEPEQTLGLDASFAAAAVSDSVASLDFYHLSPFALHQAPKLKQISVDPVVRVTFSSAQLLGLVHFLQTADSAPRS